MPFLNLNPMSYSLLQKGAGDFEDDLDTKVCFQESQEGKFRGHRTATRMIMGILLAISLLITAALCVLLIIDITIRLRHSASRNPWNIQSTYGSNFDYMSLDHKFDYLWDDELVENNGVIRLPSYMNSNSEQERGAIGMFVRILSVIYFR
jgi:hypothetical protein